MGRQPGWLVTQTGRPAIEGRRGVRRFVGMWSGRIHDWPHHLEVTCEETREDPGDSAGASSGLVVLSGQEGWPRALASPEPRPP